MIRFTRSFRLLSLRSFAAKAEQNESLEDGIIGDTAVPPELEERLEEQKRYEEYIKKRQNVSRFPSEYVERKYKTGLPTLVDSAMIKNKSYFAKLYARHGKELGVEAGVCWPTKQELQTIKDDEREYDLTLEKKIVMLAERKLEEIKEFDRLYSETSKAVDSLPKQIDGYYQRLKKTEKVEEDRLKKNRELMDKVREYYGYELDSKDLRAVEMIKKLKEDEKSLSKKDKKAKMMTSAANTKK